MGRFGRQRAIGLAGGRQTAEGKLVDLSYPFNAQTIYWPTAKTFTLEKVAEGETEGGYFYAANNFEGCRARRNPPRRAGPLLAQRRTRPMRSRSAG